MAYAVEMTLGAGNKVSLNYQSEEVSVSITYKLERQDVDVLEIVKQKAPELIEAHRLAWERVRDAKTPRTPAPVAKITQNIGLEESMAGESTSAESTSAESTPELSGEEVDSVDESGDEPGTEEEDTFQDDNLLGEEQQEDQAPVTPAQVQVILALSRALELDEKTLKSRLSIHADESVLECLTHAEAAALIVAMSRERREHLDRERSASG